MRKRLLNWIWIVALIAAPLTLAAPVKAESGCHRNGPPSEPTPVRSGNANG